VTLGPWAATPSKPGYAPALSPDELAALTRLDGAPPVYALGGVTPSTVADCLAAGARGAAVMGAVMRAERPDAVVRDLLARLPLEVPS
jgi:thiamine monophosphate synthase